MVLSESIRNDVKCGADLSLPNVLAPTSLSKDFFVSYIILYFDLAIIWGRGGLSGTPVDPPLLFSI